MAYGKYKKTALFVFFFGFFFSFNCFLSLDSKVSKLSNAMHMEWSGEETSNIYVEWLLDPVSWKSRCKLNININFHKITTSIFIFNDGFLIHMELRLSSSRSRRFHHKQQSHITNCLHHKFFTTRRWLDALTLCLQS